MKWTTTEVFAEKKYFKNGETKNRKNIYKIPHKEKKERMNETAHVIETDIKRKWSKRAFSSPTHKQTKKIKDRRKSIETEGKGGESFNV